MDRDEIGSLHNLFEEKDSKPAVVLTPVVTILNSNDDKIPS